ncbi:long-chain-fatty-acid--CoA ligase [Streptomyces sp. NBC_00258]|uniref:long-chain-fatty-acid--CoA ligase n=1 Tax=Streptomyces sp. NBC_00258 TaxID=2903642 RepID=UPI002E2E1548|nr:long-chain fatty acid--CoA ligase [Streptomyces sp. NBC_00258]
MANLSHNLVQAAARHPRRPALRMGEQVWTYAEVDVMSARVAAGLTADGLWPGDRVGLMLPNGPAFVVLYYGILRAGGTVVPINPLFKAREVEHYLSDSGTRRLFAAEQSMREAEPAARATDTHLARIDPSDITAGAGAHEPLATVADRDGEATAAIFYTSGTTGHPKGAELTHHNLARNADAVTRLFELTEQDVVLGCLPLFHIFGQGCAMNTALQQGACLVLLPRFDPAAVLHAIEQHRVTVFEGVPTMYAALLQQQSDADTSSLRLCVSGGASLPVPVLHAFEQRFGCAVLEGFGMSECSPVVSFNHLHRPRKPGSVGTPIKGVEVRVLAPDGTEVQGGAVGELAVRGHNVMTGYWQRPEATAEAIPDGWLRTGDLVRQDEDGYLFVVDRKKDMIIRGGYNIYPREIEDVLYEHPDILEVAVIGIPHDTLGEDVAAAIVLRPGVEQRPDELRQFVKDRVAPYKYPRQIVFLDGLPKGGSGKVLKREIAIPR